MDPNCNHMNEEKTLKSSVSEDNFFLPNFCEVHSVFVLCIGAELIAIMLILATGDVLWASWDELGLLSVLVQWIVFASAGMLCLSRHSLAKLSVPVAAFLAYGLIILTTAVFSGFGQYLLIKINYQWGTSPQTIGDFVIRCVLISGIITFMALRYFYVQQQWKRKIELESQARVEALQSRIRPHFLFNSMNIIASLIPSKPKLAEQAVEDLSEIFRATLRDRGSMVSLAEEWHLCRNYLRIEGLRLGNRLTIEEDLSAVPQDAAIPMLTLQPLVENAVYHGIQSLEKGGTIKIRGIMKENLISIYLSNPVPPPSQARSQQGNRIAMANIAHRLNLLLGSHAKLKVTVTQHEYEVLLTFPYLRSET